MTAPITVGSGTGLQVVWRPLAIGGGGLTTHLSISNDGETILTCGDVDGVYLFDSDSETWESLQQPKRGTPYALSTDNPGLYHNTQGPTDVRVAPSDANRIYYFVKPSGVDSTVSKTYLMRSTDRGQTFTVCPGYENAHYANGSGVAVMGGNTSNSNEKFHYPKIGIDPSNPNVIYVPFPGTGNRPRMSTDGGNTFSEISTLPEQVANTMGACAWAIDPSSPIVGGRHQIIACYMFNDGIYLTDDGGETWDEIRNMASVAFADSIQFSPDGVLFAALLNDGVYRHETGTTWTEVLNSTTNVKLAVHPTEAGRIAVLIPSGSFRHSTDHGDTFTTHAVSGAAFSGDNAWQVDQQGSIKFGTGNCRAIAWNPGVSDELWVCHTQGMCRSTLTGSGFGTWEVVVEGIEELVGNDIVHISGKSHVNLFNWDEGGFLKLKSALDTPPSEKTGPPAMTAWDGLYNVWQASVDPQDTDLVVTAGNKRFPVTLAGSGYSQDGGETWSDFAASPSTIGDGQYQQICVNDGVILWVAGRSSSGTVLPVRSTDMGATWTALTTSDFPGHTGAADSGFSNGGFVNHRLIAGDSVDPDTWYMMNRNTSDRVNLAGCWRSTDRGQTFTLLTPGTGTPGSGTPGSNPWYNNSLIFCLQLKAVPGHGGHLMMCSNSTSGPTFPGSTPFSFERSTDGGESWSQLSSDIRLVSAFGFGKEATGASYPTIFFAGFYQGYFGLYRVEDYDIATIVQLVNSDSDLYPASMGTYAVSAVEGDKDLFGRVYVGFGNHGFAYNDEVSGVRPLRLRL